MGEIQVAEAAEGKRVIMLCEEDAGVAPRPW